jgi:glycine hydroxymethyltransferase
MEWDAVFLDSSLEQIDPVLAEAIAKEAARQREAVNLLAPSMLAPTAVRQALSSVFNDLDAEGYAGDWQDNECPEDLAQFGETYYRRGPRKYNPCGPFAEFVELTAARRIAHLFSSNTGLDPTELYVNVQPLSGAAANIAILRALLEPGDPLLSLDMAAGGHLSHGANFHYSGATYRAFHYGLSSDGRIDLDQLEDRIREAAPKVVIVGGSSYPRSIEWRQIRDVLNRAARPPLLIADVAHFAGLIAAGYYNNPLPFADVVSMVGYKTLGGPRIGVIVARNVEIARRINRAVFPGIQSAPIMGAIAGLAVAARIAGTIQFQSLIKQSLRNAQLICNALRECEFNLEFGGTDTHMLLVRLSRPTLPLVSALERLGILTNSNMLPGDIGAGEARGIRIGTVGVTERGLSEKAAVELGRLLSEAIRSVSKNTNIDSGDHLRERVVSFAIENLRAPGIFQRGYV